MKKAIVIGASSGIGRELVKVLAQDGYVVGLTGRRLESLESLQREIPTASFIKQMDVSQSAQAMQQLEELIRKMGVSSIAALRGSGTAPAYNASKVFLTNYLEGLRQSVTKLNLPIIVTEIQSGLVDTAILGCASGKSGQANLRCH